MPDERIIDRGFMRRDIPQRSVFGLHSAVRYQPDTLRAWPQVHVNESAHMLVLRSFGYPNCHVVVAATHARPPLSDVSDPAAQNDGLIQSLDHRYRQALDGIPVHSRVVLSDSNRARLMPAHPHERVD